MKNNKNWDRSQRLCVLCQNPYIPNRYWQKTCSAKCGYTHQNQKKVKPINNNNCARCSKSLVGKKANAVYCSKTCKSMDHNFKHRSKTRVLSTARRAEIWKRDGEQCYLCQKPISLRELEIDHLIPVSKNGSNSPTNLAASCSRCNKSRGNRIEEAQIKKLAELRNQA
jgi:predicted nucleic acid-binding Zn ribbon protein